MLARCSRSLRTSVQGTRTAWAVTMINAAFNFTLICFISVFFLNFLNILIGSAGSRWLSLAQTGRRSLRHMVQRRRGGK